MAIERLSRIALISVAAAGAAYLLFRLRFALVTVSLSTMLAYALLPLVNACARLRIRGHPLPRLVAVAAVTIVVILAVYAVFSLGAGPLAREARRAAFHFGQYRVRLVGLLTGARASIKASLPPDLSGLVDDAFARAGALMVEAISRTLRTTAEWASHSLEVILVPVLAFYFLIDLPALKHDLLGFLPPATRKPVLLAAPRLDRILAGYVRGQIILMVIAWLVVWVGLAVLRIRYALLLGIVAGLTRAIPIVGPVLGAIPIVGLALLQSTGRGIAALAFFVVLQVIESKVIMPQVIGRELELHGATILLALLIGNALFGLVGMFLAAPLAAFAKELLRLSEPGGAWSEGGL